MVRVLLLATLAAVILAASASTLKPIIGGSPAPRSTYRHIALLVIENRKTVLTCTGSVIGRRWILTAAHCVEDRGTSNDIIKDLSAVYVDQPSYDPRRNVPFYDIKTVYVHRFYRPTAENFANDVALLELDTNIRWANYKPVRMTTTPRAGTRVLAAGFGSVTSSGRDPKVVMEVPLLSQSLATCRKTEPRSFRRQIQTRFHVCASSLGFPNKGGQDTCQGDSGGPLFRVLKGRLQQYGITSFGPEDCGSSGTVGYYARVSSYKRDLQRIMRRNSVAGTRFKKLV